MDPSPETPTIEQVRQLQAQAQQARDARARAEAERDSAQRQLSELLEQHGCATVEELSAKAEQARQIAVARFTAAQQALATS